jgi:outer membrane protein TolC
MRTVLLFTILTTSIYSQTLHSLIDEALSHAPSLEVIKARLEANDQAIEIADQFANPQLLLTTNSLPNDQAMSQSVVTVQQKIPYFSKREKNQNVFIAREAVLQERLHKAQSELVYAIKTEAYQLWQTQELLRITDLYINFTKQNIKLYESYTSIDAAQHMGIMKAELSLSQLRIEKERLQAQAAQIYARLSALATQDVHHLEIDLQMDAKPNKKTMQQLLKNNPDLALRQKEILQQNAKVKLAKINNYPDFTLVAGYAHRQNFENYFNVGFGMTLPIYGTEDAKEQQQKKLLLAKQASKQDTKLQLDGELQAYYVEMVASYNIYHIIQDDALPQVQHMFDLSSSSIATGGDLFKYIDVLFQKLDLEKKSVLAIGAYNQTKAKIEKLQGMIR